MTYPSQQASHLQLELLDLRMRWSPRWRKSSQLPARMRKQKSPRRLSHQREPAPLVATDRHRQHGAVHDAEERHRQVPIQSLRVQPQLAQSLRNLCQRTQLRQVPRKHLLPGRQSRMPLRLFRQRLLLRRSQLQPLEQQTRSQNQTRPRMPPEQRPSSRRLSRQQARAPRVARVRRLRHGANHGAAELRCSLRRQRRLHQQLHPRQHRPRRLPHRSRRTRIHRQRQPRRRRLQRAARQLPSHPRLPSHPPRRRHQPIPTRTILPPQLGHPARPAHR